MSTILSATDCVSLPCVNPPTQQRLIDATEIRLSEIIAALSVALDITQGQPEGHCMRSALLGMRLAEELQLSAADRSALFYALLLKDLGCSSNAAKISYLFGGDDRQIKRTSRLTDWSSAGQALKHVWQNAAPGRGASAKLAKMPSILKAGLDTKLANVRCERGADIARALRLPEATARAIFELDEHWDGRGFPCRLKGEEISLLARICCLAQTAELFFTTHGLTAAIDVAQERRGKWFDPQLVDALETVQSDRTFWDRLVSDDLVSELSQWEPEETILVADENCLDRVAEAFARVVDAKSPWTYQHSARVAEIAVGVAQQFGCPADVQRDIRRAALLHDIGKLGVSNLILDKPGKPTDQELVQIRRHADYSQQILEQVSAFHRLADVASAHHERLDGRGYHRRLTGQELPWVARVLAVADVCEAMSAKRPYRDALPWEQIQDVLRRETGTGVDPECFQALERWHEREGLGSRVELQMREVERLLGDL